MAYEPMSDTCGSGVTSSNGMIALLEPPKKNLGEQAYDRLLDLIITRELPAGTVLQERLLSSLLNVSRTPTREALNRLESEGFLLRGAGRILVVKAISVRDLIEILHVRRVLEAECVTLAIQRIPPGELDNVETAIRGLIARESVSANEDWVVDNQFHGLIGRHSGNAVLAKMVQDLRTRTRVFDSKRVPERFMIGHKEHLAIIAALRAGALSEARHGIEAHLDHVRESILRKLGEM